MLFKKVICGISGGVDSAIAALILKNKGFEVHGVFMKNWDEIDEFGKCSGEKDWEEAQWICKKLNIQLSQVNFVKQYWNEVFRSFLEDYENGVTPNPDILCNRYIKFNYFYKYAREILNGDAIATGHYARNSFGCFLERFRDDQNAKLLKSTDTFKDQTFFLSQIPQNALKRTMFPLGNLCKSEVKEIAKQNDLLRLANKKESIGFCFIGQREFKDFIADYIEAKKGDFVDHDTGFIVGSHNGIHNWTVGQRCKITGCMKPYFVLKKEIITNKIFVCAGTEHPALKTNIIYTEPPNWINRDPFENKFIINCEFRFQHTKPLVKCKIFSTNVNNGNLFVKLEEPLRAITPGQYAVFYNNAECLGNARILAPGPS